MDDVRPNPDALLVAVQKQETQAQPGTLKVVLGMARGVGKTYAMLKADPRGRTAGRDVMAGPNRLV